MASPSSRKTLEALVFHLCIRIMAYLAIPRRIEVFISFTVQGVVNQVPNLQVTHYPADLSAKPEIIVNAGYDTVLKTSRPQRQKLEVPINIRPGDQLDFVVDPRNNHDCDGLYIVEAKIWPPIENERTKKKRLLA